MLTVAYYGVGVDEDKLLYRQHSNGGVRSRNNYPNTLIVSPLTSEITNPCRKCPHLILI